MKVVLLIFLLIAGAARGHERPLGPAAGTVGGVASEDLKRRRGELVPPPEAFDLEERDRVTVSELRGQLRDLRRVKYYLVNGDLRRARAHLASLSHTQTRLRPVVHRYLAILAFVESDFARALAHLSIPELQQIPQFGKICLLKVLAQLVLSETRDLEASWSRCQAENVGNFRERNLVWLETLIQLKTAPRPGVTEAPLAARLALLGTDDLKTLMKLALYLNQEKLVADQIPELDADQLRDPEVRELAGQVLFRTGALAKAYRFVEDLPSPNAENIKGNLYVLRGKYELAYAQFKLALEQKQNSQNALERLLPLAWLLGDWAGGVTYAERVIAGPQTLVNKLTMLAAFAMQKGDYDRTTEILETINRRSEKGAEIDVTQVAMFTALMQNRPDVARRNAVESCGRYDLVSCWTAFQLGQWDAFPLTLRREEPLPERREWETLAAADTGAPLTETNFVNQLDIEELDDRLIRLVPAP
jgi:tetratricopeptide (TPR) repeat protein